MGQAIDARSDIYSLGVLLYEMLTGEVPFHAETQVGVAMKHVNEPLPDVQERRRRGVRGARGCCRDGDGEGPRAALPDDARRCSRDLESALEVEVVARRAFDRRGDDRPRLGAAAPATHLHPRRVSVGRDPAGAGAAGGGRRDRGAHGRGRAGGRERRPAATRVAARAARATSTRWTGDGSQSTPTRSARDRRRPDRRHGRARTTRGQPRQGRGRARTSTRASRWRPKALEMRTDDGGLGLEVYGTADGPAARHIAGWGSRSAAPTGVEQRDEVPVDTAGQGAVLPALDHKPGRPPTTAIPRRDQTRSALLELIPRTRKGRAARSRTRVRARGARRRARRAGRTTRDRGSRSASNSFPNTLVSVNPGIVLSSLTSTSPSSVTKKSQRARPAHADDRVDPRGELADPLRGSPRRSAPGRRGPSRRRSTSPRSRTSPRGRRSRPGREVSGSSLPITEHSTSLPVALASTITRGSWRRAASIASSSSRSGPVDLGDPDARAQPRGLHPQRRARSWPPARATPPRPRRRSATCGMP